MHRTVADKLLDFCEYSAEEIAQKWYKDVSGNARTSSYRSLSKEKYVHQAVSLLKDLRRIYFADNPYQEVLQFWEGRHYVEDTYDGGVPLHEAIYALILLRRNIWLYAESQAVFTSVIDMYQAISSINRVILLFDYAIYIVALKYQEMARQQS